MQMKRITPLPKASPLNNPRYSPFSSILQFLERRTSRGKGEGKALKERERVSGAGRRIGERSHTRERGLHSRNVYNDRSIGYRAACKEAGQDLSSK